ncbi:hypothetical protein M885DRAFT_610086 [Pelagophyceae sp. CCMP2097]|nr:hypothetical protein M885DRAFT_610086 [Pelagophyceae sp. CCMP2097]
MIYDLIDVWRDTVEELGGFQGFVCLVLGMLVFVGVVQYTVTKRHGRTAFDSMNRQRAQLSRPAGRRR